MQFDVKVYSESAGLGRLAVEAGDARAARAVTEGRGYTVLEVRELGGGTGKAARPFSRQNAFPLLQFSQQLHGLLRAGLGLVESLEALEEKEPSPKIRPVLRHLLERVGNGLSFSAALEQDPAAFPPFYVASLRASEQSGDLAACLQRYIAYQKQIDSLRKQVVSAMIYPALLLVVGTLVTLFLLGYVVPRFSRIYESRVGDLPFLSRLMLDWGQLVSRHPTALAAAGLALLGGAAWLLLQPGFRAAMAERAWRMPWLGERLRTYQLSRLFRTLGMLLQGGMPVSAATELVPGLLPPALRPLLERARQRIREGESMSAAFLEAGLTTPVAYRLLRVGERSGQMADMMENIAVFHDEEINQDIAVFTRIFEPAMMALVGVLVGGIVILMYMPIFDLAGSLQ